MVSTTGGSSRRRFLTVGAAWAAASVFREALMSAGQPPAPASNTPAQAVEDLVTANRVLAHLGVLDGYGHVSARHPRVRDRFLLSRSIAPELVAAGDVMEYNLDGGAVDPQGRLSYLERFIHSEIYRARTDVNSIVHCHTPSVIPFANSTIVMRPMYHMSSFVAEGVPVFEIRDVAGLSNMLVTDGRLGQALARTLGSRSAALMRGHGAVVVGDAIPTAVARAVYLDLNARLQAQAIALGGTVTYLDPEEARLWNSTNRYDRSWELWKKSMGR